MGNPLKTVLKRISRGRESGYAERCLLPLTTNLTLKEYNAERAKQMEFVQSFNQKVGGRFRILCDGCKTAMVPQEFIVQAEDHQERQMVCPNEHCKKVGYKWV